MLVASCVALVHNICVLGQLLKGNYSHFNKIFIQLYFIYLLSLISEYQYKHVPKETFVETLKVVEICFKVINGLLLCTS